MRKKAVSGVFLSVLAIGSSARASKYPITDIGALSGGTSFAYAINNSGQVTGYSTDVSNGTGTAAHAFIYSGGTMSDLGTFGGVSSQGNAIDGNGNVAGQFNVTTSASHAFVYSSGSASDIGTLGGTNSYATAINASGTVAGYSNNSSAISLAYSDSNGTMTAFSPAGSFGTTGSVANGINSAGDIVGWAYLPGFVQHAFFYSGSTMNDLGTLGGSSSIAYKINSAGKIVGQSRTTDNKLHAFIYANSVMSDLGTLGGTISLAYGINSSDQVVGFARTTNNVQHAMVYSNGNMLDLNNVLAPGISGWTLTEARSINDSGTICGVGTNPSGKSHGYIATPVPTLALIAGVLNDDPAKDNLTPASSILQYPSGKNVGSIDVLSQPSNSSDPFILLLGLSGADSTFIKNLISDTGSSSFTVLSDACTGTDLAQWDALKGAAGGNWNCAVKYNSLPDPANPDASDFSWDFTLNPAVRLTSIALVPEPGMISGMSLLLGGLLLSRRSQRTLKSPA